MGGAVPGFTHTIVLLGGGKCVCVRERDLSEDILDLRVGGQVVRVLRLRPFSANNVMLVRKRRSCVSDLR